MKEQRQKRKDDDENVKETDAVDTRVLGEEQRKDEQRWSKVQQRMHKSRVEQCLVVVEEEVVDAAFEPQSVPVVVAVVVSSVYPSYFVVPFAFVQLAFWHIFLVLLLFLMPLDVYFSCVVHSNNYDYDE